MSLPVSSWIIFYHPNPGSCRPSLTPPVATRSAGDATSRDDRPQRVLMTFTELSSDVLETIRRDDVRVQVSQDLDTWWSDHPHL